MDSEGMHVEPDSFTDADRALLKDLQVREEPRTMQDVREVDDGFIVRSHERREVFTFHAPETGTFRFDVRGIKDSILAGRIETQMFRIDEIPEHFYQHVLNNNGVETDRIEQINGRDLERPGIMVMWPDGHSTMIDGNHRLCRRYQLGVRGFRFLMVDVWDCVAHMCRPGDERKLFSKPEPGVEVLHTEVRSED